MTRRIIFAVLLSILLFFAASCGAMPDHEFIDNIPEIIPAIPAEETFVYQGNDYSIVVNVETMLPYYFFGYSEGFFQVCYDGEGSHYDAGDEGGWGSPTGHDSRCLNVGFIDESGFVIIPLEYRLGPPFSEEMVVLTGHNHLYTYADASGEQAFPMEFNQAGSFNKDGLAAVGKDIGNGNWMSGVINKDGEYVLPLQSRYLEFMPNGLLLVTEFDQDSTKYGMMNADGDIIIPIQHINIGWEISEDLIMVETGERLTGHTLWDTPGRKQGFYDIHGNLVIPVELEYTYINNFYEGLASVMSVIGDDVLDAEYNINARLYLYGFIDKTGELVIPMEYHNADRFIEGLAMVGIVDKLSRSIDDMRYGFIDTMGNEAVPIIYADAKEFSDGLAAVGIKTDAGIKYGYVNKYGEVVIPYVYEAVDFFINGFAWVKAANLYGTINSTGDVVIPFTYQNYKVVSDELIAVKSENLWGLIDFTGQVVVPSLFDSVDTFSHGLAVVEKDGKYGIINTNGEIIAPLEYDEIQRFDDFIIVRADRLRGIWRVMPT